MKASILNIFEWSLNQIVLEVFGYGGCTGGDAETRTLWGVGCRWEADAVVDHIAAGCPGGRVETGVEKHPGCGWLRVAKATVSSGDS